MPIRHQIEQELLRDVEKARLRLQRIHPDKQLSASSRRDAYSALKKALSRFTQFVLNGEVPPDIVQRTNSGAALKSAGDVDLHRNGGGGGS
jgi:hypothetical protein